MIGRNLGQYQIISEIGHGGMATVYKAYQPLMNRYVAVKVLAPHLSHDREFVERFVREATAAGRLRHPNIVTIYEVQQQAGIYYIVMEYVEGQSLAEIIRREGPLSPERTVRIAAQVASALDYAHSQGLVHRDVKPGNILVGPGDHVTLTDFGIARAIAVAGTTRPGVVWGTPAYMAPEQVLGEPVGPQADVYALGMVCYEMLTGRTPFQGETPAVLHAQVYKPPPDPTKFHPGLPERVCVVLEEALAKKPQQRYPSAGALAQALAMAVRAGAVPPPWWPAMAIVSGIVVLALLIVFIPKVLGPWEETFLLTPTPAQSTPTAPLKTSPTAPLVPTNKPTVPPLPTATLRLTATLAPSPTPSPALPPTATLPPPTPTAPPVVCAHPGSCLTYPLNGSTVRGVVEIRGTANVNEFARYKVEYRPTNETTWRWLVERYMPVTNGVLMQWDTSTVPPGRCALRLTVVYRTGNYPPPHEIEVYVER